MLIVLMIGVLIMHDVLQNYVTMKVIVITTSIIIKIIIILIMILSMMTMTCIADQTSDTPLLATSPPPLVTLLLPDARFLL